MADQDGPDDTASLSEQIVTGIADSEGVDATELNEPLYSAINPDALEALFDRPPAENGMTELSFRYQGYDITVEADHTITITAATD